MQTFTRAGLTFDVVDTGPADGPVVVLLHGFPQFADSWTEVAGVLAANGFRCLAPDQRGYSPGARPGGRRPYRMSELAADVLALVDASGAGRVHLVGHDWGAAVAWAFAAQHPERLTTLSALSVPHPAAFLHAMRSSRQFLASWYIYAFQLPWLPERVLLGRDGSDGGALARFLVKAGQTPERARHDAEAMRRRGALGTAINWYRAIPLADPRAIRAKVAVPTLFVWSDGDTAVLRAGAERCGEFVTGPYRFEVLRGVSHWMLDQARDDVTRLLLEQFAG